MAKQSPKASYNYQRRVLAKKKYVRVHRELMDRIRKRHGK